jgi:hypothetical protein
MKEVDAGYLIKSSYPYKNHKRYDLNNGNSYLLKANHSYYGVSQGAVIKIYQEELRLLADWGNIPLLEVIKLSDL